MGPIHTTDRSVKRIALAAFPGYKGRSFELRSIAHPMDLRDSWEGGSRNYYRFVRLADLAVSGEVPAQSAFDTRVAGLESVTVPPGFACVQHCIFCGKDLGLRVHANPVDLAPLLPAPASLTRAESLVLAIVRSLKSSARAEEARRFGLDAATWDMVKAGLIIAGMLNRAGAITDAGRNAIGRRDAREFRLNEPNVWGM
jgi:hypothetical protein